jgi:hypothetical protein
MIGLAVILTVATATASVRQIISDATSYHVTKGHMSKIKYPSELVN